MAKNFEVTLKKSTIGCTQSQIKTVASLGLRKTGSSAVLADNPANRGQILKVQHLLQVEVAKAGKTSVEKRK
ncbi:MAG: 50S ribosomal protein L30 [Bdellovibrionales bacterium]